MPTAENEREPAASVTVFEVVTAEEDEEDEPATVECEYCGRIHDGDETNAVGNRFYCDGCVSSCAECGDTHLTDDLHSTRNARNRAVSICDSCRDDNYRECASCGDLEHDDRLTYRAHLDADYCPDCDPGEEESGVIQDYHSTRKQVSPLPSPWTDAHTNGRGMTFGRKGQPRFFGVELEVEVVQGDREDAAGRILNAVAYKKGPITEGRHPHSTLLGAESDGSLDNGFELVSAPMGLDDHARLWEVVTDPSLRKGLRSHGTDTCGLHIHVTRAGLSEIQIAKMVCFLNADANEPLIRAVGRRYSTGYCEKKVKRIGTANSSYDRYEFLNLCNTRTIEFRLFKGTLHLPAILAALEFANALVEFAHDSSGAGMNLSTLAFLRFLKTPRMLADTKRLRAYLIARNFAPFVSL